MRFTQNLYLVNKNQLVRLLGIIFMIEGSTMILPLVSAALHNEHKCMIAFAVTGSVIVAAGLLIRRFVPSIDSRLRSRDGFLFVIVSMFCAILIGAIPYLAAGYGYSFTDAWFESASGWTTTGAFVLNKRELPFSLILWKSEMNFMGGFVMIFLTVSIFQKLGIGSQKSVAQDLPGANFEKLGNKVSDTARILLTVYIALALVELTLLISQGMTPYYALVNSLSTMSTSGIIDLSAASGSFDLTARMKFIMTIFTILASLNFVVYYLIYTRKFRLAFHNYEIKLYLIEIAACTIAIALPLWIDGRYTAVSSIGNAFVQTVSYASTSGFTLSDINSWPTFSRTILIFLPLIGGCGFSTASGLRVHRAVILFKVVVRGFYKRIHPKSMRAVIVNGKAIPADRVASITVLTLLYFAVLVVAAVVFSLQDLGIETSFTASLACLTNNGTGFGLVKSGSFALFSPPLRWFATFVMIAGKLELFGFFVLFSRSFWDTNRVTS
ncbi:MAG: TrkH family potassium uptake protein [Eubacterium sp.]|nr:TrkH family potassium uptake protein [Eubacterium sp.]